jgi:hypothetical protein
VTVEDPYHVEKHGQAPVRAARLKGGGVVALGENRVEKGGKNR